MGMPAIPEVPVALVYSISGAKVARSFDWRPETNPVILQAEIRKVKINKYGQVMSTPYRFLSES
jgi:hypothetical protein